MGFDCWVSNNRYWRVDSCDGCDNCIVVVVVSDDVSIDVAADDVVVVGDGESVVDVVVGSGVFAIIDVIIASVDIIAAIDVADIVDVDIDVGAAVADAAVV